MALKYTPELPKAVDWFWIKSTSGDSRPIIRKVVPDYRPNGMAYIEYDTHTQAIRQGQYLFAGPIDRPEEDSE